MPDFINNMVTGGGDQVVVITLTLTFNVVLTASEQDALKNGMKEKMIADLGLAETNAIIIVEIIRVFSRMLASSSRILEEIK